MASSGKRVAPRPDRRARTTAGSHRGAPTRGGVHAGTQAGAHAAPHTISSPLIRRTAPLLVAGALALTGTSAAVAVGVMAGPDDGGATASLASVTDRMQGEDSASSSLSRSDRRRAVDPAKVSMLSQSSGRAVTGSEDLSDAGPRDIARALMGEYGFADSQFDCLDSIWTQESQWRVTADNPTSSAYGIPQALPGIKMATEGADWRTNAETQIRWGLGYIADRYGTPCQAWDFKQGHGYY